MREFACIPSHQAGTPGDVARGDHPQRTPFYGVCLLMCAFGMCGLASIAHPVWVAAALWLGAVTVGLVGFGMTFRDYG